MIFTGSCPIVDKLSICRYLMQGTRQGMIAIFSFLSFCNLYLNQILHFYIYLLDVDICGRQLKPKTRYANITTTQTLPQLRDIAKFTSYQEFLVDAI